MREPNASKDAAILSATASRSHDAWSVLNGVGFRGPAEAEAYGDACGTGDGAGANEECRAGGTNMFETWALTPSVNARHAGPSCGGP